MMNDNSMENKMKAAIDSLYTICLSADGLEPQQQIQARENIDALRMLCAYQTFDMKPHAEKTLDCAPSLKVKRNRGARIKARHSDLMPKTTRTD